MSEKRTEFDRVVIKNEKIYIDQKLQKNIDGITCEIVFPIKDVSHNSAIYLKDKNAIFFVSPQLWKSQSNTKTIIRKVTSDISKFHVFGSGILSKDQKHVYLWGKPIDNVDAETFELIPSYYFAKDKKHVYYYAEYQPCFVPLLYADPKTFVSFRDAQGNYSSFGSDLDNLYTNWELFNIHKWNWRGKTIYENGKMFENKFNEANSRIVDFITANKNMKEYWWGTNYAKKPSDCKAIGKFHYAKSNSAVYTKHKYYNTPELIQGADPNSFVPITEQFSNDNKSVFYYGDKIIGVNPKFARIPISKVSLIDTNYITDDKHVFCITLKRGEFHSFIITDADPKTFKITNAIWTEDKNNTYKNGVVHTANKNTNKVIVTKINDRFSKDEEFVFWDGSAITKSDPITFEVLFNDPPQLWAKDKINLYNANGHRIVKGIEGAKFNILDTIYGSDNSKIFCFESERILTSIDLDTFEIIKETGLSKDKNGYYFMGKKISKKKHEEILSILEPLTKDLMELRKKRREII